MRPFHWPVSLPVSPRFICNGPLKRPRFRFSVPIGREMKRAVVAGIDLLQRHLSTTNVCCSGRGGGQAGDLAVNANGRQPEAVAGRGAG
jgi:hypothetical protein